MFLATFAEIYLFFSKADEYEAVFCHVGKFTIKMIDPMYPLELISLVNQRKLVTLNKLENLNSNASCKVCIVIQFFV